MNNIKIKNIKDIRLHIKILIYFGFFFSPIFIVIEIFNIYGVPFTEIHGMYYQRQHEFLNALNIEADIKKSSLIKSINELKDDGSALVKDQSLITDIVEIKKLKNIDTKSLKNNKYVNDLVNKINEISGIHGLYKSLQVADCSGIIMASTNPSDIGRDVSKEGFFTAAFKSKYPAYFSVLKESENNLLVMNYTHRFVIKQETYLLIISFYFFNFIKPILNGDIDSANTNDIVLSGPDFGYVVYANNVSLREPNKIKSQIMDIVRNGEEGCIIAEDYKGIKVIAAYRYLIITPELSWVMVIKHAESDIYSPIRQYIRRRIIFLLIILFVIIWAIYFISKTITKPIIDLTNSADVIAKGDYSHGIKIASQDEIGSLTHAVNIMADSLKGAIDDTQRMAHLGNWRFDIKTNSLYWSKEMYKIYGVRPETFKPDVRTLDNFVHPDDKESFQEFIKNSWLNINNKETIQEYRICLPDGTIRFLQTRFETAFDIDNKPTLLTGTVQDITEIKLVEEELREKSAQLERAQDDLIRKEKLTVLGQLSGRVAHDLRNPLGVMSNAVYYLKAVLSDADKKIYEYLDIISAEINRSTHIISELLDFARTKNPKKEIISIKELLDHSISTISIPDNITVRIECAKLNMLGDPVQIGQIFNNIILNAVQAMLPSKDNDQGGGYLDIDCSGSVDEVIISFRDSGIGIEKENMDKIFHPLYTTKTKGIGLGLTIIKNLTEANGGIIEVKSKVGEGTTFILKFKVAGRPPMPQGDLTINA